MASELLSAIEVRNAKPGDKPRKLRDGNGLNLLVHPNGSKYFQLRYTLHGKEKTFQLGVYPAMGLADGRVAAKAARQLVITGIDPVQNKRIESVKKASSATNTFRCVADQWLNIKQRTLAPSTPRKIKETFSANVSPRFGNLPITEVSALVVRNAMQVMERRGALELMQKCRAWIRSVFDFALSEEMIEHNPVPERIEFNDMDTDWTPHGTIKRMLTAEKITDRILGVRKTATVSTRTLFLGSGNNVGPVRDLLRRVVTITIHLDPRCSTPATMTHKSFPVERVRKQRGVYIAAVLTIVLAWRKAGSPRAAADSIVTFGGLWSDYCRHPLMWLGQPDPATALLEQIRHDPDADALAGLMTQWRRAFGSAPTTVRKAVDVAQKGLCCKKKGQTRTMRVT